MSNPWFNNQGFFLINIHMTGIAIHRDQDQRICGAKTEVKGQNNVFINNKLASVKGDTNTHKKGELNASNSDGTVFINNIPVVLLNSTAKKDLLCDVVGPPHCNPYASSASPDVFACGGGPVEPVGSDVTYATSSSGGSYRSGRSGGRNVSDRNDGSVTSNAPDASPVNFDGDAIQKGACISKRLQQDTGMTKAAADGIIGNILVESDQFRADTEYGKNGGGGRGWIQWTGPRRRNFEAYANKNNLDPRSDTANYNYLIYEMQGYDGNHWTRGYSFEEYKRIQDPEKAAQYFMEGYERPGVPNLTNRKRGAIQVANTECKE